MNVPPTSTPSLYAIRSSLTRRRPARTCRHGRPDLRAAGRARPRATRRRRSAARGRCPSRCPRRAAGRRGPPWRCSPSPAARTGSRRCLRRTRRGWSRRPRPRHTRWRGRCCACCADGRRPAAPSSADGCDEPGDAARRTDADRVGEDDLVRRAACDPLGESQHVVGRDGAFERAAERDADRHRRPDPVGTGAADDAQRGLDRFGDRGSLVSLVELSVAENAKCTSSSPAARRRS